MLSPRLLVIDNYDSFTFNLVQYLGQMGVELVVVRNDAVTLAAVAELAPAAVIISPGPKRPEDAGLSVEIIRHFGARTPILGVCLGHQCIGQAYGGTIVKDRVVHHGKTSPVFHDGETVFRGLPSPLVGARYHSLAISPEDLPGCLRVSARTQDGVIMAVRHESHPVEGLQFHPESFLTPLGFEVLRNFVEHYSSLPRCRPAGHQRCSAGVARRAIPHGLAALRGSGR